MKTLKKYIENNPIKVNELAIKVGIDQSLMSRIISGKRLPTEQQIAKIAEVMNISKTELIKESLGIKIYQILKSYPELANDAMCLAEERIKYLQGENKFKTIVIDTALKEKLNTIDECKNKWLMKRPLSGPILNKMQEYFHTAYTFESNRIEGNTLTLQETHLVINEGITIGGKAVKEHLEALNHKEATELILDIVKSKLELTQNRLLQIHQLILKGVDTRHAGKYRKVSVRISGSRHLPAEPYLIDSMMEDYFNFYLSSRNQIHPVLLAAEMHERLVTIHPFIDGNGRTARLVMNLMLLQNGYTIANLKGNRENRLRYYKALESVQLHHERSDFYHLIADHVFQSLQEHLELTN